MAPLPRLWILMGIVHLTVGGPVLGAESSGDVDARARGLFHSLMSPYCPGSLLAECPSSQATVLRDSVRARLVRGQSDEQIRQDLVAVYGSEILASPPFEGLGTLTWLGAGAIFLGGLGVAAGWLRWRRTPGSVSPQAPAATPDDLQRLRRELAEQD